MTTVEERADYTMERDRIAVEKDVAEVNFLIHDLHVKKYIDDIIHFHATLDMDLEIYNIEQAKKAHWQDLRELKSLAGTMRKAYNHYYAAVRELSANLEVFSTGTTYIKIVRELCDLILNLLWERFDSAVSLLPHESRSYRSRDSYRSYLRWICGIYYRIGNFIQGMRTHQLYEEFDVADEVYEFTNNVLYGYVAEKGASKTEILFENVESAVVGGNKSHYQSMYFHLIQNAVDAMLGQQNGKIAVRVQKNGDHIYLQVEDNGIGMTSPEVKELLSGSEGMDGAWESNGFAVVQKTVQEFGGRLSVNSVPGRGTTITVGVPCLAGRIKPKTRSSKYERYFDCKLGDTQSNASITVRNDARKVNISEIWNTGVTLEEGRTERSETAEREELDKERHCGAILYNDYKTSQAQFPGCLFAISVNVQNTLDFFCHKPYEKYFNINHEDLSPMLYESTVRGRLEENEKGNPEIVLKPPCSVREFFEFKNVAEKERCGCKYRQMMHDEYILIARKLVDSGLPPSFGVLASNMPEFFANFDTIFKKEPFPLTLLARQKLTTEER